MDLYLNLHGGVAGDMLVAGLLAAGAPRATLEEVLESLPGEFRWEVRDEQRQGIAGQRFVVDADEGHVHRHLSDVLAILADAALSARARGWAEAAFRALADAEGRAHGVAPESVHFHEVGAVDAIVDVAAACALLDALSPHTVRCSPVPVGSGVVRCAHGDMPVPAPGTAFLLEGMPTCGRDLAGERATPTGVALLRGWQVDFGPPPAATLLRSGHGLGSRDPQDRANLLRVEVEEPALGGEWLVELRTLIDDQTGEVVGDALERLRTAGAVDAYACAAFGKKHRPAFEVVVLCEAERQAEFEASCFGLLGTLGIRVTPVRRARALRDIEMRDTPLGPLPFKVRRGEGGESWSKPEFDALRLLAEAQGLTPREALERLQQDDGGGA